MQNFQRPTLNERFQQFGYLLKHTVTIVGRDGDILGPVLRMMLYAAVLVGVFFAMLWGYAAGATQIGNALLATSLVLFVYKFFYYNRQELALSWLVYEVAAGRDRDGADAAARVKMLKPQIRILALLDMGAAWIERQSRKGGSTGRGLMMSALTEGWDLVNHFLLPVFAIEGLGFRDGMARLKATRENVPETIMGVFGIDIMGRLVTSIVAPIYAVMAVGGIVLGIWLAPALPQTFYGGTIGEVVPPEVLDWLPVTAEAQFNWLPLLVCIFSGKIFSAVFARLVVALKVIYFTLFYARTLHAEDLSPDIRGELERYLRFDDAEDVARNASQPSPPVRSA